MFIFRIIASILMLTLVLPFLLMAFVVQDENKKDHKHFNDKINHPHPQL